MADSQAAALPNGGALSDAAVPQDEPNFAVPQMPLELLGTTAAEPLADCIMQLENSAPTVGTKISDAGSLSVSAA